MVEGTYDLSEFLEITDILHCGVFVLETSKGMISRLAISEEPPLLEELAVWSVLLSIPILPRQSSELLTVSLIINPTHPSPSRSV